MADKHRSKKSVAYTISNDYWEAHNYPQQTGCKQWMSPCRKSNGEQQFLCFMAREKYKASAAGQRAPKTCWYSLDDMTTGSIQKRVLRAKPVVSLAALQREGEQQWPVPQGAGSHPTAPGHFNHCHCIPGKHPAAQWLLTLQLSDECIAQRAFPSAKLILTIQVLKTE